MTKKIFFFCFYVTSLYSQNNEIIRFTSPNNNTLATYISSANFRNQGDTSLVRTYTINEPGTYILTEDIASSVVSTSTAIVYINSDDVILNLGGHTLSQTSSETSIDGIAIEVGKDNITIENGIIKDCTGNGIGINYDCSNIIIKNVWIKNCTISGINLLGISSGAINNVEIKNSNMSLNTGDSSNDGIGLKLSYCIACKIIDCNMNNNSNTNASRSAYGVYTNNCQSITFNGVKTNKHIGRVLGCGFYFESCDSLLVQNCYSINNETTTDNALNPVVGFYLNDVVRSIFENSSTTQNIGKKMGYGFYLYESICNYFYQCKALATHITSTTSNAHMAVGFQFSQYSNSNVLDQCAGNSQLNYSSSGVNGEGWGFDTRDSHANFVYDSMFSSNRGYNSGGGGVWRLTSYRNNAVTVNSGSNTGANNGYSVISEVSISIVESISGGSNAGLITTHYPNS